jgi:hypothetical protein
MNGKRAILRVQLDADAKTRLIELCERRGMTQIAVMSRLIEWFVRQDEVIQVSVLGLLSQEHCAPLAHRLLQQLSEPGQTPLSTNSPQ